MEANSASTGVEIYLNSVEAGLGNKIPGRPEQRQTVQVFTRNIFQVLKSCSDDDDDECENLLKEAKERSNILGDRFVHTLAQKVEQIEQECLEVSHNRIKIN